MLRELYGRSGIAGVAQDPPGRASSTFSDSLANHQSYPAYPVLAPSRSEGYGPGGDHHGSAPNHGGGDYGYGQASYAQAAPQHQPQQQSYEQQPSRQQQYGGAGGGYAAPQQAPQVALLVRTRDIC